ncbi:MAG TPA: c-type cytochrome [Kiritimatiellia bacterium]|nr:c-type cytochrome [Kiritimatiellia bacterium]HMO97802.1 c-type cytochrome [Kiritimatiellia bacterium]HMP96394.1 c-type cytochrome [Kiritimatiellia bacterium]
MSEHEHQPNDFQDREIRLKPLGIFLAATLVLTVLAVAGMKVLFDRYAGMSTEQAAELVDRVMASNRPTNAVVEGVGEAAVAMAHMKAEVDAALNHYRWVDAEAGIVQIPIERAMERVAEKGLPVRRAVDTSGRESETPVQAGERYFTELGCIACHGAVSGALGPSLVGVYNHEVKLADGATIIADEAYLRESILNPTASMVEGYLPVMPAFAGVVTDAQLDALVAYIKSLAE